MAIGPIEMNGAVGRTQDFAAFRAHEEQRGQAEQHTIVQQEEKEAQSRPTQVQQTQKGENRELRGDADGRGSGGYTGDGGRRRPGKKGEIPADGVVIVGGGGFDVKI